MGEAKPTPGPCYHHGPSGSQHTAGGFINTTPDRNGSPVICSVYGTNGQPHEANARLIIDAFDTMTVTGLTPSQLVERVKELEEALQGLDEAYCRAGSPLTREERFEDCKRLIAARAALSKARPNTAEPQGVAYALPDFDTVEQHIYGACRRYITQDMLEPIHNLIREAVDADRASNGGAPAGAAREPTAFIHWPIDGPPRLVWYSQKALNDAILKTYEGHQPDVKLYTAQTAPAAAKEPSP